jgi:hypothetical protein
VNGPRDQLLAGAGLALQEHVRLGRRNQIHLTQHALKGLALADDAINGHDLRRLLTQVIPLQLQLLLQMLDLLERTAVGNRHRGVRGEHG